jgi:hypothetical protein
MNSFLSTLLIIVLVAVFADAEYVTSRESVASPPTDIYFPSCVGVDNECASALPEGQLFPAVIFLQGGSVDAAYYSIIAAKIASKGFIVAVPNAPRTIVFGQSVQLTTPQIAVGAKNTLRNLDLAPTSGIYGRLEDSFSLVGHSFGGVIAMIAGAHDAPAQCSQFPLRILCFGYTGFGGPVKSVIVYGSSLVDRGRLGGITIFNLDTTGVPTILIRGKNDGRVLIQDVQTTYDASLETPKAFIELDHANHFGITDSQTITGAMTDSSPQDKSQDWSTSQIAKIIVAGLAAHVTGEANALEKIYVTNSLGPSFVTVSAAQLQ